MIDTTSEMIGGYTVATLVYGGYVLTLWLRARRVRAGSLSRTKNRSATLRDPSLRSG